MTRHRIVLTTSVLFVLAAAAGGVWFFINRISSDVPPGSTTTPLPPPAANLPNPPTGYEIFKNNNPTMRLELKNELTKKFEEVVEQLKKESGNSLLWIDLGSIKYAFEDFLGAEAAWKHAVAINPLADAAHLNLAAMYQYKTSNYPGAEKALRAAIDLNSPAKLTAYAELFDLYRYRYSARENLAEGVMLEAYREFPATHAILKTLAWHFLENGDKDRAIEYFEKFLKKVPDDESAKEELARLKP